MFTPVYVHTLYMFTPVYVHTLYMFTPCICSHLYMFTLCICSHPVYVHTCICSHPVYVHTCICLHPVYVHTLYMFIFQYVLIAWYWIRDRNNYRTYSGMRENLNILQSQFCNTGKQVKDSRNRPGVAQRVPGGLGSQIFMTFGAWRWRVVSLTHRPPLPPGNVPGTYFH